MNEIKEAIATCIQTAQKTFILKLGKMPLFGEFDFAVPCEYNNKKENLQIK